MISVQQIIVTLNEIYGLLPSGIAGVIAIIITAMIIITGAFVIIVDTRMEKWECVLLMGLILVIGPGSGGIYSFIYLIPGFILLITTDKVNRKTLICVLCTVFVLSCVITTSFLMHDAINSSKGVVCTILTVFLIVCSFKSVIKTKHVQESIEATNARQI